MCWTSVNTIQVYVFNVTVKLFLSMGVRVIFCQGGGKPLAQDFYKTKLAQIFTKQSNRNEGRCNNIGRTGIWKWLDTVFQSQYLPSLSINYRRRHKQTFGKIATTVVLAKDENLLWPGLQWHRSCHSNEMNPLPIMLAAIFLRGNRSQELFPPIVASMFVKLKRNL